jgi:hypothetical protein
VIRGVVQDPVGLARWEAQVRREFRPVPWSATVDALLAGLGDPLAVAPVAVAKPIAQAHAEVMQEIG